MNRERKQLVLLVGLGLAIRLFLATRDPLQMGVWPLHDDSYYYYTIAHNLVSGAGLRHDSFHTTTGFQPLFLLLILPLFALLEDKYLVVNAVLLLQTGISLVCCVIFYRIAKLFGSPWLGVLATAVWAISESMVGVDLNGMETNTALCLFLATVYTYLRWCVLSQPTGLAVQARLGLLCGFAFLARVDLGMLLPVIALDQLWRGRKAGLSSSASRLAVLVACAALPMLPWLVFNVMDSGSILPGGGQAVRFMSLASHPLAARSVEAPPILYYVDMARAALHAVFAVLNGMVPVVAGLAIVGSALTFAPREFLRRLNDARFVFVFLALLFVAYAGYIFGPWFFRRYLAPFMVGYLVLLASALAALEPVIKMRWPWLAARRASFAALLVLVWPLYWLAKNIAFVIEEPVPARHYNVAIWLNQHTRPEAVIGVFQSGIIGYFLERRFHDLDGKVNLEALAALREERIDEYVVEHRIDYVVDFQEVLDPLFTGRARDKTFLSRQTLLSYRPEQIYQLHVE